MKNKKGFSLFELMTVLVLLGVIAAIAVPSYNGYIKSSRNRTYKAYENSLEDAAQLFVADCLKNNKCKIDENGVAYKLNNYISYNIEGGKINGNPITYKTLLENKYLDKLIDPSSKTQCNGFVKVNKSGEKYTYNSYLICGKDSNTLTYYSELTNEEQNEFGSFYESDAKDYINDPTIILVKPSLGVKELKEWYSEKPDSVTILFSNINVNGAVVKYGENVLVCNSKIKSLECQFKNIDKNSKKYVIDGYEQGKEKFSYEFQINIDDTLPVITKTKGSSTYVKKDEVEYKIEDYESRIKKYELKLGNEIIDSKYDINESKVIFNYIFDKSGEYILNVCNHAEKCVTKKIEHKATNIFPIVGISSNKTEEKIKIQTLILNLTEVGEAPLNLVDNKINYYLSTNSNLTSLEGLTKATAKLNVGFTIGYLLTGEYYLYIESFENEAELLVKFTNQVGNVTINGKKYAKFGPYVFDNTGPDCEIISSNTSSTAKLTLTAKTNATDLYSLPYSWNNSSYSNTNKIDVTTNDIYTLKIKDDVGNYSTCEYHVTNIDNMVPSIIYTKYLNSDGTQYTPGKWTNKSVNVSYEVNSSTDNLSSIIYYQKGKYYASNSWITTTLLLQNTVNINSKIYNNTIEISNSSAPLQLCTKATTTYEVYSEKCSENINIDKIKPYTPYISSATNGGNSASNLIKLEDCNSDKLNSNTTCTINYKDPNDGLFGWGNTNDDYSILRLSFESLDQGSGVNLFQYSINNSTWNEFSGFNTAIDAITKELAKNASKNIYVRSVDNVGNISPVLTITLTRKTTNV